MNIKSFILGILTGIVLTIAVLIVIGLANQNSNEIDSIEYLDQPLSYEGKNETSFKVLQVLGNSALAKEISNEDFELYFGNTVVILGENFYSNQIVKINNPVRIGSYNYTTQSGIPKTVPVIDGIMEE